MFAIAVYDGRRGRLVLARDPAGQKPLYFARRPGKWILLASTLAPLIRYAGAELEVDAAMVEDYVRFGFPPGDRAILEHVHRVPPGSFVILERDGEPIVRRYFDLVAYADQVDTQDDDEPAQLEAFRDLMQSAVRSRLISDVPLGAFLSSGVDSSLIVALMAEQDPQSVKTYTIGFEEPEFDESEHARKIAAHLGVQNTVEVLRGRDVLEQLGDVVRYFWTNARQTRRRPPADRNYDVLAFCRKLDQLAEIALSFAQVRDHVVTVVTCRLDVLRRCFGDGRNQVRHIVASQRWSM